MSENILVGNGCLGFLGIPTLVLWALAMFTDTRVGRFYDSLSNVKNGTAFCLPVIGLSFTTGGVLILLEPVFPDAEDAWALASAVSLLLLTLGLVFRFPIPLPRWMYPQWHAQRRRAALAAASTTSAPSPASTDPGSRHDPHPEQHEQPPHKEPQ